MGVEKQLPGVLPLLGLGYTSQLNDLAPNQALFCKNLVKYPSGIYGTRWGFDTIFSGLGGCWGLVIHASDTNFSAPPGEDTGRVLALGQGDGKVYALDFTHGTITSSVGPTFSSTQSVIATSSTNRRAALSFFSISEDLGTGFESSPTTVDDLLTTIDADASIAVSWTTTTVPAAFILSHYESLTQAVDPDPLENFINWYEPTEVLPGFRDTGNLVDDRVTLSKEDAELGRFCQFVNTAGSVFFTLPGNGLLKYDGNTIYQPGALNEGLGSSFGSTMKPTVALGGAGSLTGTYYYANTIVYIDNQGRVIETDLTDASSSISPSSQDVSVQLRNATDNTGRFPTRGAIVVGAQSAETEIDVDNGSGGDHSLQVGDTAYFFDRTGGGEYTERTVTARTSTTITISGAAVDLNDNDIISNNVRIRVKRTLDSGTSFYSHSEIPNNPYSATQTITDSTADASLGGEYIPPSSGFERNNRAADTISMADGSEVDMSNPDAIELHQGLLFLAKGRYIRWSNPESVEYQHQLNNLEVPQVGGEGRVTHLLSIGNTLVVFKQRAIYTIQGDFTSGNLSLERFSGAIGAVSNGVVRAVDSNTWLFVSERGFEALDRNFTLQLITPHVAPIVSVRPRPESTESLLSATREDTSSFFPSIGSAPETVILAATYALADPSRGRYRVTFKSHLDGDSASKRATYRVFEIKWPEQEVYELSTNVGTTEGGIFFDNRFWWIETADQAESTRGQDSVHRELIQNSKYSHVDHTSSIETFWQSGWFTGGNEAIPKKVNDVSLLTLDQIYPSSDDVTVKVYQDWGTTVQSQGDVAFDRRVKKFTLKPDNAEAWSFRFETNTLYERLLLSGFRLEVAPSHRSAIRSKR